MSEFSERIVKQTEALLHFQHDETLQETTPERLHEALGQVIMMEISDKWTKTKRRQAPGRRAFYFSAEYLVGRLVYSNLFNLGILRGMKAAFAEKGVDLACLEHIEDAALGNGGLGRLAACFLDSAATLDLPLTGYGFAIASACSSSRSSMAASVKMPTTGRNTATRGATAATSWPSRSNLPTRPSTASRMICP